MPLRNRITPQGEIEADPARGNFMGNRGILHNAEKQLGRRRWAHDNWIVCLTKFRGRHREVMSARSYTELFFLDEAVAIAAGHRPCYECRRQDYHAWTDAWRISHSMNIPPRAKAMDRALHRERVDRSTRRQKTWRCSLNSLPDGTFILWEEAPHLVLGEKLLRWSHGGYTKLTKQTAAPDIEVLTPLTAVRVLAAGFRPHLHHSAMTRKIGQRREITPSRTQYLVS